MTHIDWRRRRVEKFTCGGEDVKFPYKSRLVLNLPFFPFIVLDSGNRKLKRDHIAGQFATREQLRHQNLVPAKLRTDYLPTFDDIFWFGFEPPHLETYSFLNDGQRSLANFHEGLTTFKPRNVR